MKNKTVYISIFIIFFSVLRGQVPVITEYNGIVFEKGEYNDTKESYTILCSDYIKDNYSQKKITSNLFSY